MLHLDGSPVEPDLVRRIARPVAYRGPDDTGELNLPGCFLIHHQFRATRACARESQPLFRADHQLAIVADARLDQRVELIQALRRGGRQLANDVPNSRLLLEAYLAWDDAFLERIAGDFAFLILDRRRQRVLAARDPFGLRSLYFGEFDRGLVLSNDPLPVMAHPDVDLKLDRLALGDFLLTGRITSVDHTLTPFLAIRQLAPGHQLIVDLTTGQRKTQRFWHFPMRNKTLRYRSSAEYCDHFLDVLKVAVTERLDAPAVVAPMSGGMDSTTAVAVAAEVMADGFGPDRFTAVTAVREESQEEGVLAAEVCRTLGVDHCLLQVAPGKPMADWRSEPFPQCDFFRYHEANRKRSAALGRVSFNAASADYVLAPEWFSIVGQLRAAGFRDTWSALRVLRAVHGYRPRLGSGLLTRLRGERVANPFFREAYPFPEWLDTNFQREFAFEDRWTAFWISEPQPRHPLRPNAHRFIVGRDTLTMHSLGWPVDFAPPIPVDPFLDRRVIEFLWSLPPLPWFYNKHIVREAMRGRLPAKVLNRPKTSAGKWVPAQALWNQNFSWRPGPILEQMVDPLKLRALDSDSAELADFHPMFLQKWLDSVARDLCSATGRVVQLSV